MITNHVFCWLDVTVWYLIQKKQWWVAVKNIDYSLNLFWAHSLLAVSPAGQSVRLTLLQFAHFINDGNNSTYLKRLSWGLNGLIQVKHLKHFLTSSKCFLKKRYLLIYYYKCLYIPGPVLESWREVSCGPCSQRAYESYTDHLHVMCSGLYVKYMSVAMAEAWLRLFQTEYLSCFLKIRNCASEEAGEGHFV